MIISTNILIDEETEKSLSYLSEKVEWNSSFGGNKNDPYDNIKEYLGNLRGLPSIENDLQAVSCVNSINEFLEKHEAIYKNTGKIPAYTGGVASHSVQRDTEKYIVMDKPEDGYIDMEKWDKKKKEEKRIKNEQ